MRDQKQRSQAIVGTKDDAAESSTIGPRPSLVQNARSKRVWSLLIPLRCSQHPTHHMLDVSGHAVLNHPLLIHPGNLAKYTYERLRLLTLAAHERHVVCTRTNALAFLYHPALFGEGDRPELLAPTVVTNSLLSVYLRHLVPAPGCTSEVLYSRTMTRDQLLLGLLPTWKATYSTPTLVHTLGIPWKEIHTFNLLGLPPVGNMNKRGTGATFR